MEDRSIIKPILDALDYFNNSKEELSHFYNIIDKFSAYWFGKKINISKFSNIELLLIHDLLGEFIRFEENNKRVALWLLSINRVCYNYAADLSIINNELIKMNNDENQDVDTSLIDPILKQLKKLDDVQKNRGKKHLLNLDILTNYIQWVMVYSTIIYPSLEDKLDFYNKTTIKAMNYILMEFIQQQSNDRRIAFMIMGIIEACKQYLLQNQEESEKFLDNYKDTEDEIIPGQEEEFVKKILDRLKDENIKQRENNVFLQDITADQYLNERFKKFIEDLNEDINYPSSNLNKYLLKFTSKFVSYNSVQQILFLKTLLNYDLKNLILKKEIKNKLLKSLNLLPDKTKSWFNSELNKVNKDINKYINNIVGNVNSKDFSSKFNFSKPYIMLFLIKKLGLV